MLLTIFYRLRPGTVSLKIASNDPATSALGARFALMVSHELREPERHFVGLFTTARRLQTRSPPRSRWSRVRPKLAAKLKTTSDFRGCSKNCPDWSRRREFAAAVMQRAERESLIPLDSVRLAVRGGPKSRSLRVTLDVGCRRDRLSGCSWLIAVNPSRSWPGSRGSPS